MFSWIWGKEKTAQEIADKVITPARYRALRKKYKSAGLKFLDCNSKKSCKRLGDKHKILENAMNIVVAKNNINLED